MRIYKENNNLNIRNKIVLEYIDLVKSIAKNYSKYTSIAMEELANMFYISVTRVRNIEVRALRTLRNPKETKLLRPYLEYDCCEYEFDPKMSIRR